MGKIDRICESSIKVSTITKLANYNWLTIICNNKSYFT